MNYEFIHADFMYNITSGFLVNDKGLSKWDVIPFIGVGMIHNSDWKSTCKCPGRASGSHPFAFSYGIEARYRVSDRVHAVAEVCGMTTAKNFDCVHPSSKFGDNMLTASLGLSFSIGKTGWKRVIDAKPYIEENVYLRKLVTCFHNERDDIQKLFGGENSKITYPKNSYSGLLSLRSRLANTGKGSKIITDGDSDEVSQCSRHDSNGEDGMYSNDTTYFSTGKTDAVVPVYFFFRLNSDSLVDNSQLINLDEIALAAKQHGYRISITGAADSVTGTEKKNNELSRKRANYIASELVKRGIDKEKLHDHSLGGIDKYKPCEANRFSMVVLTR
jgi:outer membrane protein OmpA-like peptidoglycan-associated protein